MNTAQEKRDDEQRRHSPERVKEKRIFIGIVMRRMREVASKFSCCTRMALLTCRDDVVMTEMRFRIGNFPNVVRAMTVIALRGFRIAKLRYLSVIGVEVCFCNRLVTSSALLHDLQLESLFIRASDRMRGMAIVADRQRFVRLPDQRCVHTLAELLFDSVVTVAACFRKILLMNARSRIAMREDVMRGMAVRTRCRYGQPALHQTASMNALRVTLDDFSFGAGVSHCGFLAFAMAGSAQVGDVRRERRRGRIFLAFDFMRAMAFFTGRTIRIVLRD